jgi:hypothetical protein
VLLLAIAVLAAVQQFLPAPANTLFWEKVYNAGHATLFGTMSLVVLGVSLTLRPSPADLRFRHYAFAFGVSLLAGIVTELMQWVGQVRFGEFDDVVVNALGSATFLAVASTFDREMVRLYRLPRHRVMVLAMSAIVMGIVFAPVPIAVMAGRFRDAAFPRLNGFETYWDLQFLKTTPFTEVRLAPAKDGGEVRFTEVTFHPARAAIVVLCDPHPDWTGYDRLVLELRSDLPHPVLLGMKIDDLDDSRQVFPLFSREFVVHPGDNRITVPLSEIRAAPKGREMDMSHISGLAIYAVQPEESFSLYLDELHLE